MFSLIASGKITKRILPGSESVVDKTEGSSFSPLQSNLNFFDYGKNYVNEISDEFQEENGGYTELTKSDLPCSSMSCIDSVTYDGSIFDLKDLNIDEIKLFKHYKFKDPLDVSNNLEISRFKDEILQTVNSNCTVLITGVTGCGKSTQVPQFILDDCVKRKKYCNIVVTQPRRIAAISVSKQVNKERGWKNGLTVGYQVGRKKDFNPDTTKILYCTTGILLQKIIRGKSLAEFTHIILDEVHERSLEMDFLLLIIKKLLKTRNEPTRVILMSATAETFKLCDYFSEYYGPPLNKYVCPPNINVSKVHNYNIVKFYLEDLFGIIPSARRMELNKPVIEEAGFETAVNLVKEFDSLEINDEQKSSVLIFLPGIFEIEELYHRMEKLITFEYFKWVLIPLHSSITNEEQARVFDTAPLNYRKIILSTNIAESSVTVPDVSYVIDFCLMKQLKNEIRSNYSMLVMTWASKSNCEQRAGRVGRVKDGRVYRLVPKNMYDENFEDNEMPEMSRCSLSRIILMSKILDMGTPKQLLASALDPPILSNIVLTILTLKQVGALLPTVNGIISSVDGDLTYMGKIMAHLPLEPPMSKLIYFGYIFNILNEAIIMACGLSVKSIFSQPFNKRLEAYAQKLTWTNNSCSDPIAYISPYQSWLERKPEFDRNRSVENLWAKKHFIQLSVIRDLYDLIDDVTHRLRTSFNISYNSGNMKWSKSPEKAMACKVILAGAFYPNYFTRGMCNSYMDEHQLLKTLDEHDPNRTIYFTNFPNDQPKELYKEALENMFPSNFIGKPTVYFNNTNKLYVEFPTSKINNGTNSNQKQEHQLVPGDICFGVYVAMKMRQLKFDFKIPLLKPDDANKRVKLLKQKAVKKIPQNQIILPIQKCVIDEIEPNVKIIDVLISFFQSIDCFWVQLYDATNKEKLHNIWNIVNSKIHVTNVIESNLIVGEIYIVIHVNEKYRAKLIHLSSDHQKKYKFFLIDFGETLELLIEDIYDILNENEKKIVFNIASLAVQCRFAKIRPKIHDHLKISSWSKEANDIFSMYDNYSQKLSGTIYSIVDGVLSFEDLRYEDQENSISIPKLLIEKNLAVLSEASFASKVNHEKRQTVGNTLNKLYQKPTNLNLDIKSPTEEESYTTHYLKGPYTPLEMSVNGITCNSVTKLINIEGQSVNSVLLDTNPNEYHDRLFVAGNVCTNERDRLTLWDTTMMPNIPGMPAIICLIFSPCVEIRYNPSYTKMVGALCGLGYDSETSRPLFAENDIEIVFDTMMDFNVLNEINKIRMLLNKCVNPEDEEGPGEIFEIQHNLQMTLIELLSRPIKFIAPECTSSKYMWSSIPKSLLKSPFQENSPFEHPMAGSDVYKLLWGVNLSQTMCLSESKQLMYKLCKIKRLEDSFSYSNFSSEVNYEELYCPLCQLSFSNNTSMSMHFKNHQHMERYKNAKDELLHFYKGPFSDIQHL